MRIANWNVNHARESRRRDALRTVMDSIGADVWILTETHASLEPGSDYRCVARSKPSDELPEDESWVSIWSRMPMLDELQTADAAFSAGATLELGDGTPLTVFGTVLPWRGRGWQGHPSEGAVAFEAALRSQQTDWASATRNPRNAVCVAGDFNQDLSTKSYYWSRKAYEALRMTLTANGLTAATADPTDPVRSLTDGTSACIDHICLSESLTARQQARSVAWSPTLDGRVLSDHHGIYVDVDC